MKYIDNLYNWTLKKAGHPKAKYFLAFIAFIESSLFLIPPDVILIPMILNNRLKAWYFATICTVSSVLGALLGYVIGVFLFDTIGMIILEFYNFTEDLIAIKHYYAKYGLWFVLGGGFTPFPYKLITISSGFFSLNIPLFILASVISRGGRFFCVAAILWYFGESSKFFIEKHYGKFTIVFFFLLVICLPIIKLL